MSVEYARPTPSLRINSQLPRKWLLAVKQMHAWQQRGMFSWGALHAASSAAILVLESDME